MEDAPEALFRPTTTPTQTAANMIQSPGQTMLGTGLVLSELPIGNAKGMISLWGKNLLNEDKPNFFIDFGANSQRLITAYFPDPRTYGGSLGLRF